MNITWLESIDSTNSEALRRLAELPSGTVLSARDQTAGRGQRGNSWFTEAGKNLTFSLVLKFGQGALPALKAADAPWLNYLASHVVALFLEEQGVSARIKWPNDIYVDRRKICGMLLENALAGKELAASVVGIGLNINQTHFPQLANATSLALCSGRSYSLEACLERIATLFEQELPGLFTDAGRTALFAAYSARLFQQGVQAHYRDLLLDQEFTGVIEGVAPDGRLCIRDTAGSRRHYWFKEVSYIL